MHESTRRKREHSVKEAGKDARKMLQHMSEHTLISHTLFLQCRDVEGSLEQNKIKKKPLPRR